MRMAFVLTEDVAKREEGNSDTSYNMHELKDIVPSKISQSHVQFYLYEVP